MYNALVLTGNANAAGVNHHDLQVLKVEHANYFAKSSFFFMKTKKSRLLCFLPLVRPVGGQ